jgi:hypothetical protein
MTTQLDASIGIVKEPSYGTTTTPTHFPEFLSESLEWKRTDVQGHGFRQGSRTPRVERNYTGKNYGEGDIEVECVAKGIGIFFEALLGASTSTALTAPAYQQNFTMATSDPFNSYTIQKGVPLVGGAVQQHTFSGAVCTKGDLTSAQGEIVKLKTSWNAQKIDTTTAYTAPSYIASNELFTFTEGAITIGGSVTAPTTTTLATGGTSVGDVVDFSLSLDNKLNVDGYTYGGGGKQSRRPTLGEAAITGKITAEFDSTTYRDAYLNQTSLNLVLTFTSTTQLASGIFNTLQVYIPTLRLDGDIPNATNGVVRQSMGFRGLDNGSGVSPITVCLRTLDTAV